MSKLELEEGYDQIEVIPDYGFSGRTDLEEVILPETVRKIGRYAFYNCRNLRKITFFSQIQDIGCGAFTGCHNICELDITIVNDNYACLKDILQELEEKTTVYLRDKGFMVLVFPEYYEEGIENTPARLINFQVHGSGMKYRNCLLKKEIKFAEYDACFPMAQVLEKPEVVQEMVLGRLRYPYQLMDTGRKRYETYTKEHLVEIGTRLIKENDIQGLSWLLDSYLDKEDDLSKLIEEASKKEAVECVGIMMDIRRARFVKETVFGIPDFDFDF